MFIDSLSTPLTEKSSWFYTASKYALAKNSSLPEASATPVLTIIENRSGAVSSNANQTTPLVGSGTAITASATPAASAESEESTGTTTIQAGTEPSVLTLDWSSYNVSVVYNDLSDISSLDEKMVSSQAQTPEVFDTFDIAEYTPAKLRVITIKNQEPIARSFEFMIGPSSMSRSSSNTVNSVKTGQGYFLYRSGPELTRLSLAGVFMESSLTDERRLFLENYYKQYLVDKVNAFHEYFNETYLYIDLLGYTYQCIPLTFDLTRTSTQMFTFNYSLSVIVLAETPITKVSSPRLMSTKSRAYKKFKAEQIKLGINATTLLNSTAFSTLLSAYSSLASTSTSSTLSAMYSWLTSGATASKI